MIEELSEKKNHRICPAILKSDSKKSMDTEFQMAWNESGTVGYVVFIGSRIGDVNSTIQMRVCEFTLTKLLD